MTPMEKDIEKALRRMVGRHGGLCLKWVCPGWLGVPDRMVLLPGGRIIFVELKRPEGGERSKMQKWWANTLSNLGFLHLWIKNPQEIHELELVILEWIGGDRNDD